MAGRAARHALRHGSRRQRRDPARRAARGRADRRRRARATRSTRGVTSASSPGCGRTGSWSRASLDEALAVPSDVLVVATSSFLREVAVPMEAGHPRGSRRADDERGGGLPVDRRRGARAAARRAGARGRRGGGGARDQPGVRLRRARLDAHGRRLGRLGHRGRAGRRPLGLRRATCSTASASGSTPRPSPRASTTGAVTGHIGFPQSIRIVAHALGRPLERIDREIEPIVTEHPLTSRELEVAPGLVGGFTQRYKGIVDGETWFEAHLIGHLDPPSIGEPLRDLIRIHGAAELSLDLVPGLNAQSTVSAVLVNSVGRIRRAEPGWRLVTELPRRCASAEMTAAARRRSSSATSRSSRTRSSTRRRRSTTSARQTFAVGDEVHREVLGPAQRADGRVGRARGGGLPASCRRWPRGRAPRRRSTDEVIAEVLGHLLARLQRTTSRALPRAARLGRVARRTTIPRGMLLEALRERARARPSRSRSASTTTRNLTRRMLDAVDIVTAYRTCPHTDLKECGAQAAAPARARGARARSARSAPWPGGR